jgi:hypothetical protein
MGMVREVYYYPLAEVRTDDGADYTLYVHRNRDYTGTYVITEDTFTGVIHDDDLLFQVKDDVWVKELKQGLFSHSCPPPNNPITFELMRDGVFVSRVSGDLDAPDLYSMGGLEDHLEETTMAAYYRDSDTSQYPDYMQDQIEFAENYTYFYGSLFFHSGDYTKPENVVYLDSLYYACPIMVYLDDNTLMMYFYQSARFYDIEQVKVYDQLMTGRFENKTAVGYLRELAAEGTHDADKIIAGENFTYAYTAFYLHSGDFNDPKNVVKWPYLCWTCPVVEQIDENTLLIKIDNDSRYYDIKKKRLY